MPIYLFLFIKKNEIIIDKESLSVFIQTRNVAQKVAIIVSCIIIRPDEVSASLTKEKETLYISEVQMSCLLTSNLENFRGLRFELNYYPLKNVVVNACLLSL